MNIATKQKQKTEKIFQMGLEKKTLQDDFWKQDGE